MENVKTYEFLLKLNTHLRRQDLLAKKLLTEEYKMTQKLMEAQATVPLEVFTRIVDPIVSSLESRARILEELQESSQNMMEHIKEFYGEYKGTVQ